VIDYYINLIKSQKLRIRGHSSHGKLSIIKNSSHDKLARQEKKRGLVHMEILLEKGGLVHMKKTQEGKCGLTTW
jgi:hypothetical protein